jgi:eukaryotic-like serine/threonine-protein kinase
VFGLNLARVQLLRNEAPTAEPLVRKALAIREHAYPAGNWRIGEAKGLLGECLTAQGRYEDAEAMLLDAHRLLKEGPGWEGQEARETRRRLLALYEAWGRPEKAAAYRPEQRPL